MLVKRHGSLSGGGIFCSLVDGLRWVALVLLANTPVNPLHHLELPELTECVAKVVLHVVNELVRGCLCGNRSLLRDPCGLLGAVFLGGDWSNAWHRWLSGEDILSQLR